MSRCCVPNCESVFTRTEGINPERIGLFRLPTNPERRELWKRLIKLNRPLAPSDRVCSLHFASDSIKRYYESKSADGSVKILPRSKLTLGASAVPTIFPNSSKTPVIKIPKLNNENGGKSISRRSENSENTSKTIPRRTENSKRTISRITENSKESTSRETEISEKSNSRITESSEKATSRGTENRNFALRDEPPALQVYLRVKPTPSFENSTEILVNKLICRPPIQSKLFDSTAKSEFTFARIFDSETSQQEVFRRTMLPCVGDLIRSRNSLVFSYGTVNSGKSYTIQGNVANPGLLPRTLHAIFSKIEIQKEIRYVPDMVSNVNRISAAESVNELQRLKDLFKAHPSMKMYETQYHRLSQNFDDYSEYEIDRLPKCSMWVSFVEVYKEMVYDLLEPVTGNTRSQLKLCTDEDDNFYVKGLKQFCVQNAAEAYATYMFGKQNFNTSCTNMDKTASRSHCIFTIKLVNLSDPEFLTISRLSICDLAGSGKPKEARSNDGKSIDLSLFMLNRCLKTLRDNQTGDSSHTMPYRSAKLTQLLCSLFTEKNCEKVVMIVNINPSPDMFDETIEVLNVSAIARQIRRNPNASEKTIKHRRQSPSRNQYSSDDVDHRSFGLGMLNRDKESHDVEAQNMQQQIEQLKEEVKRKEGQIEDIHAKYQEMLKYMVKFHEEEVGQIKKESQQEADQRIQAIKAYYDLKINEISSTNNTYREMPIIEDSPTKLRERIIRPDEPAQIYDDMVIDEPSNDDSIEVVENNLPPSIPQQCNLPKQYSNPNSTVRNVDNRTSSWRSVGTTPQQNTPTRAKDSPVLNANAGNTTRTPTPSVQPAKKAENQYRIIATNSRLNVNKLNASNNLVAGLPAGISAQDLAEKKFKIFKLNNPLSATGAIPIVRRVIAPYQGMKTSPNLASSQNCTPERPASVASVFHVVKNTPSVQPNETKLTPSADTDKCSPIASSVAANLVNSPTGKAERVYPNVAPRFQVIKATPHVIRTPLVDAIKRPVSMPSPPVVKFAANFKSYRISAVGKSDPQAPASVQQRNLQRDGVFETYQHVIANQTNSTDNKNSKSEISVLPGNVQSKSATAGVVVIQVKPDGSGKPVGENNANINPKSAEVDVQCKQTANVETRPNENTNQSLSTSQTSDTSVSTKQMAVDGDTPLVNDHQDDVRDNDDVLVISDDTDEEDTYKGIDEAQISYFAERLYNQSGGPKLSSYECYECGKTFPLRWLRNKHAHVHKESAKNPLTCNECGKLFTRREGLTKHMNIHLGVRPYKCTFCELKFYTSAHLNRHLRIHLGLRPFKCELCGTCFRARTTLKKHLERHSDSALQCDVCRRTFKRKLHIERHMEIHIKRNRDLGPFKCDICRREFAMKEYLARHLRRDHKS